MKIKNIKLVKFKRFEHLEISEIPDTAKLVVLTGPNGSGKSSLFEGFNIWSKNHRGHGKNGDIAYIGRESGQNINAIIDSMKITFHDNDQNSEPQNRKKQFYIRSAYRHEADFTVSGISGVSDALESANNLSSLMQQESRISENYNRIVGEAVRELFDGTNPSKTKQEIRDKLIGQIRNSMRNLFGDLILSGTGNPTSGGTFRFDKGNSREFHFKNLSGGEKAAFDLLLDFIVKKETFDDTIFCIDEPELHMHTRLQAKLLEELFTLLPNNCQLWISTHSIGMARKASELSKANSGQVCFIDFHEQNFDNPAILKPIVPTRTFWNNMFHTALDDLAALVVPEKVIFCEGKKIGISDGRKPSFDTTVYSKIFSETHADTEFIPLGGTTEVERNGLISDKVLKKLAPGINTWFIFDRDDRSEVEILELKSKNIRVLLQRDLESYLWSDEILQKLATIFGDSSKGLFLISEKARLISELPTGTPVDDIKAISGKLYNICKAELSLTQCGNNSESFAISTLAPLVTPETSTYRELERIIFA